MLLAGGSLSDATPIVLLSAAVSLFTVIEVAIRVGRWISSVEVRLSAHHNDLERIGRAVAERHACPDPAAHPSITPPPAGVPDQTLGGQ